MTPDAPRTKPSCQSCRLVVEALAAWQLGPTARPASRASIRRAGRPRVSLGHYQAIQQPLYFVGAWLDHLRRVPAPPDDSAEAAEGKDGPSVHLEHNGMGAWLECWRVAKPYTRATETWGEQDVLNRRPGRLSGVISASRQRDRAMWQAARRVVAHLYGISERTLRRRMAEQDHFGERIA